MPELPEAEVAARQLAVRLTGASVTHVHVGREDIVREGGATVGWYRASSVTSVFRRGKSVIIEFRKAGATRYLVAELGMTGLLLLPTVSIKFPSMCISQWNSTERKRPRSAIGIPGGSADSRSSIVRDSTDILRNDSAAIRSM